MSCGVGHSHRCGSDPALLWLWRGLVATAPIQPLAWEPPYAVGTALEKAKRPKKKKKEKKRRDFADVIKLTILGSSWLIWVGPNVIPSVLTGRPGRFNIGERPCEDGEEKMLHSCP